MIDVEVPKTAQKGKLVVRWTPDTTNGAKKEAEPEVIEGKGADDDANMIYYGGAKCPHFSQGDSKWGSRELGSSSSISAKGCAITSVAMVLKYYGRNVNPGTLDRYLDANDGYDKNSVKWGVSFKCGESEDLPEITFSKFERSKANFASVLDDRIKNNLPTIAQVDYGSDANTKGNHFVVIVGRTKDGYIMNDPATRRGDGASDPRADNIVETTRRKQGYEIVSLRLFDVTDPEKKEEVAPPPPVVAEKPEPDKKGEKESEPVEVVFHLEIGQLNPIQEKAPDRKCVSGVQQRLNNLGFDAGCVDGVFGSLTKAAIRRFQRKFDLKVDGNSTSAVQEKLYEIHDQPGTAGPKKKDDPPAAVDPKKSPVPAKPTEPSKPAKKKEGFDKWDQYREGKYLTLPHPDYEHKSYKKKPKLKKFDKDLPATHIDKSHVPEDEIAAYIIVSDEEADYIYSHADYEKRVARQEEKLGDRKKAEKAVVKKLKGKLRGNRKRFGTTVLLFNKDKVLIDETFTGSIGPGTGASSYYTCGGLATGVYDWKTHRHKSRYAALHCTQNGQGWKLPTAGPNNNNKNFRGKSGGKTVARALFPPHRTAQNFAGAINFHASGRYTRASIGCLNIDRTGGEEIEYRKFMSHLPKGTKGKLFVRRYGDKWSTVSSDPVLKELVDQAAGKVEAWS
jgi:peptidoglycan hydrolase-like protein with peptidoglycan-binding domain